MGDAFRSRRWIALIAAYVVALQAVLLPLSAVIAAPVAAIICSAHVTGDGAPLPTENQSGCPCAAGCGTLGHGMLAPVAGVISIKRHEFSAVSAPPLRSTREVRASDWRPQAPRGPPFV